MEIKIKDKNYIFKDEMSGREEHLSGIMKFLSKILSNAELDKESLMKMLFDDDFNKCSIKMASFMSLSPKMTEDQLLDLNSADLLQIKLECLFKYAESLKGLEGMMEKKKLTIPSDSSMESYISLPMKPIDQQIRSNLSKK
jgi:hypothetical protein